MTDKQPESLDESADSLSQHIDEGHGRIGYGRIGGKYTPLGLALILIVAIIGIAIYNQWGDDIPANSIQIGAMAPAIEGMTLFDEPFSLATEQGKVVIVNFWASWCDPCRNEMPMMQETVARDPENLAIVGIDVKNDTAYPAQRFAETNAITYPLVRDDGSTGAVHGPIGMAYGIGTNYPTTVFISPTGEIAAFHIGELSQQQLDSYIEKARTFSTTG